MTRNCDKLQRRIRRGNRSPPPPPNRLPIFTIRHLLPHCATISTPVVRLRHPSLAPPSPRFPGRRTSGPVSRDLSLFETARFKQIKMPLGKKAARHGPKKSPKRPGIAIRRTRIDSVNPPLLAALTAGPMCQTDATVCASSF